MPCLELNQILRLIRQDLTSGQDAAMHEHIKRCAHCYAVMVELAWQQQQMDEDTAAESTACPRAGHSARQGHPENELTRPSDLVFRKGTRIDHFEVMRLIGKGGMGEVYLARDTELGRKVALKMVRPDKLGSAKAVERFLFEARITAKFSHPNIVTVYSVGKHEGFPYLALEYIEGQDLRDRVLDDRPSLKEALRICAAVADALVEAHAHGVLHRDLKPSNVIIAKDGRPRVVDFGIAQAVLPTRAATAPRDSEPPARTQLFNGPTGCGGTPAYMAPEQWQDQACSPATDLWALGMILFELCAGKLPPAPKDGLVGGAPGLPPLAESLVRIRRRQALVCSAEPMPKLDDVTAVPEALSELVALCLEKDPSNRPSSEQVSETLGKLVRYQWHRQRVERCPFRGLLPFSEQHAEVFFGREAEIAATVEWLRTEAILPVVGSSGAGKSSLVRAGIVPRLREQGRWMVLQLRPGDAPFAQLAAALITARREQQCLRSEPGSSGLPAAVEPARDSDPIMQLDEQRESQRPDPSLTAELEALTRQLSQSPHALSLQLRELVRGLRRKVLLVVDQLEELFTLVSDSAVQTNFMRALCLAADDPGDPVRVVFTLRDDYLGRAARSCAEARQVLRQQMVVHTPDAQMLERVMTQPLEALGYGFDDPQLAAEMVSEVPEQGALPLLQFAARTLWEKRDTKSKRLCRVDYEAMGGVAGALAQQGDAVLKGMSAEEHAVARELLLRLVTAEGTKRVMSETKLLDGLGSQAEAVLRRLVESRLVAVQAAKAAQGEGTQLELAHEALIGSWTTLARWIDESRHELAFVAEVSQAAELWQQRGHSPNELWQGRALAEALIKLERCSTEMPELARRFLAKAERRQARQQRRRRWLMALVTAGALAIAAVVILQKQEADHQRAQADHQRERAEQREGEALREGARAALEQNALLEARAKLRLSFEHADSRAARALLWKLRAEPLIWQKEFGAVIYAVQFSPDGQSIAAGSQDGGVYLLDRNTRKMRVLRGHEDQVFSVAYSKDGKRLASGTWSGSIKLWDVATGHEQRTLVGHTSVVRSLSFSPDGQLLASGGYDQTVKLWKVQTGTEYQSLAGHTAAITTVRFGPDGQLLASASYDRTIKLWNTAAGTERKNLAGHRAGVLGFSFSPDGQLLASGSNDQTIKLWNVQTGAEYESLAGHTGGVQDVSFSPDGQLLASGGYDQKVKLWEVQTGTEKQNLAGHTALIYALSFSPDGQLLASGSSDHSVKLWNVQTSTEEHRPTGHTAGVYGVSFSPDGQLLASGSSDQTIKLWRVDTGNEHRSLVGHTASVRAVSFSPDGQLLASGSRDQTIKLWNVQTSTEEHRRVGHTASVRAVSFSPDGQLLASGSSDQTIKLWNVETGAEQQNLAGHNGGVFSVNFSPDSQLLASGGSDKAVKLWNVQTGTEKHNLAGHQATVFSVSFSPDGQLLASGSSDKSVRLWNLATKEHTVLGHHLGRVYWLAFHPGGKLVGAPSSDGTARLWTVETRTHQVLSGHRSEVNFLTFSPDGQLAATSSDDGTVRTWYVKTARPYWRGTALVASGVNDAMRERDSRPRLLSHQGWYALGTSAGTQLERAQAPSHWGPEIRAAVKQRARFAYETPRGNQLCLHGYDGQLELWALSTDTSVQTVPLSDLQQVAPLAEGCAARSKNKLTLLGVDGSTKQVALAATARAMEVTHDRILVASGKRLLVFDQNGKLEQDHELDLGVTALSGRKRKVPSGAGAGVVRQVAIGYRDGNVELWQFDSRFDKPKRLSPSFEDIPSCPPVNILFGPMDTLIVGYANGLLGIWDPQSGKQLGSQRLHGQFEHLLLAHNQLYAATDLGQSMAWDLSVFYQDYCELMRELWQQVAVSWEKGRAVVKAPPPDHRCVQATPLFDVLD